MPVIRSGASDIRPIITTMPIGINLTGVWCLSLRGMLSSPGCCKCRTAVKKTGRQKEANKKETGSTSDNIRCVHDGTSYFSVSRIL